MTATQKKAKPSLWERIDSPQAHYQAILIITAVLTGLGLIMAHSASMVVSLATNSSVWVESLKQAAMVFVGFIGMILALRLQPSRIEFVSKVLLSISFLLLILVLIPGIGVGAEEVGSNSWIRLGPVGIQPSEVAKMSLAIWGSSFLAQSTRRNKDLVSGAGRFLLVSVAIMLLVGLQGDVGMVISIMIVFAALLYLVGIRTRMIVATGLLALVAMLTQIVGTGFRSDRIRVYLNALRGDFSDPRDTGYQSYQAFLSLADGSLTGKGLGQSSAKWMYLPEAKNDFVFAILGEEFGWVGAVTVVVLFFLLAFVGWRISMKQNNPTLRLLSATLTIGIVVQAFVNMGYVTGLAPVTGIQLPLISAGGTSAIITLTSIGFLANCARHEPETIASMQTEGRPFFDRLFLIPEPTSYEPGQARRDHHRPRPQRFGQPVTRGKHENQLDRYDSEKKYKAESSRKADSLYGQRRR